MTSLTTLDAIIAEAKQDLRSARKQMRQVAPTLPDTAPVQLALGLAYLALEQPRDAVRAFKQAIDLDATDPLPHYHLGALQTDMGLLPQAEEHLRFASAAEPENALYQAALGFNFYKANKQAEAMTSLEAAVAAGSEDGDVFASLGYLYYFAHRLEDSRQAFSRAIAQKPDYAEVYNNRGYLNILLGDPGAAQSDLSLCLEKEDSFLRARYNLALAQWLAGDHALARETYRTARRQDRNDAELRQHLDDFDEVAKQWPQVDLPSLRLELAVAQKAGRR